MAKIELSWQEAQREGLPSVCAVCGQPAAWFIRVSFSVSYYRFTFTRTKTVTVTLPFCDMDRTNLGALCAYEIEDESIVVGGVAEEFAEAVFEMREYAWRQRQQLRHEQDRAMGYNVPPCEDYDDPPPMRTDTSETYYQGVRIVKYVLWGLVVAVILGIVVFAVFRRYGLV